MTSLVITFKPFAFVFDLISRNQVKNEKPIREGMGLVILYAKGF